MRSDPQHIASFWQQRNVWYRAVIETQHIVKTLLRRPPYWINLDRWFRTCRFNPPERWVPLRGSAGSIRPIERNPYHVELKLPGMGLVLSAFCSMSMLMNRCSSRKNRPQLMPPLDHHLLVHGLVVIYERQIHGERKPERQKAREGRQHWTQYQYESRNSKDLAAEKVSDRIGTGHVWIFDSGRHERLRLFRSEIGFPSRRNVC